MTREEAAKRIKMILEECNEDEVAMCYVTPLQKTGQWVFVDKAHEHAYCSECGYGNVDLFNGRPHNYCPNCGAKMDEEIDDGCV